MIILLIHITASHDNVWISLGENRCWSLLGHKGLTILLVKAENDMKNYYDEHVVIKAVDQGGQQLQISYNKIVHVLQKSQIQK